MDYHKTCNAICDIVGKIATPLSTEQRVFMVAAIAPFLDQRDTRIAELERRLKDAGDPEFARQERCHHGVSHLNHCNTCD